MSFTAMVVNVEIDAPLTSAISESESSRMAFSVQFLVIACSYLEGSFGRC
jgi:hypothetical protein